MKPSTKILLVDDHALFREGVALLLRPLAGDSEILEAGSCDAAFRVLEKQPVDLVLMDLGLPGMSGLDGVRLLRERFPDLPVVVVSSADDRETVLAAVDAGAMGYIPKSSSSGVLAGALQVIMAHGIYLPPEVLIGDGAARTSSSIPATPPQASVTPTQLGLTPRQQDVLYQILQGMPAKIICRNLELSASTVKAHTSAVLRALNVTTRTQAIVAAGRLGLRFGDTSGVANARSI